MAYGIDIGQRVVAVGATGTGKSTVQTDLLKKFLSDHLNARALIIDSKPRYRATHHANGLPISYKNWVSGDTIRDSVAIYSAAELRNAFRFTRCCILQSMYPNGKEVPDFEEQAAQAAQWLFRSSHLRAPTLLIIDEWYDLLAGALAAIADRRFLRVLRAGRERSMAALIASQRPKSIPLPTLTEATKFVIFNLEYDEDVKYMRKHGPKLQHNPSGHNFVLHERNGAERAESLMRLNIRKDSDSHVAV